MVHILSRPLKEVRRRLPGLPLPAWFPPFVVFVLATIAFTWPLARNLTSQKPYLGSDPILIHAILEWERFALFNDLLSFFDGNFYYLTPGALFFGDLLLGSLPLYVVAASVLGPDGGFNIVYLSLFVFNGAAMYMLLLRITSNRWASLLGGVIFAFAPVQQFYISNYQMLMSWWTPLMLWFLLGALERRPTRNFAGATLVLLLQFATSIYWGFFALWTFLLFMLVALVWGRFRGGRARALRSLAMGGLPVAVVFLSIGLGYLRFYLDWKSSRSIDHVVYLSATLPNYFEAAYGREWLRAWKSIDFAVLRPYLISGVSGLVFAGAGVASAVTRSRRRPIIAVAALVTLTAFLFSLGPVFKWHGEPTDVSLPYQFAYDHLPGLQSLRAVERWVLASHFGLSVLAGIGSAALWHLLRRFGAWRVLLAVGVAAAVALDFGRPSVPQREYPQEIELKRVFRTLSRDPAIVVPMVDNLEIKSNYMSWSAESSALPLLNGYNGWVPPTQEHLARPGQRGEFERDAPCIRRAARLGRAHCHPRSPSHAARQLRRLDASAGGCAGRWLASGRGTVRCPPFGRSRSGGAHIDLGRDYRRAVYIESEGRGQPDRASHPGQRQPRAVAKPGESGYPPAGRAVGAGIRRRARDRVLAVPVTARHRRNGNGHAAHQARRAGESRRLPAGSQLRG